MKKIVTLTICLLTTLQLFSSWPHGALVPFGKPSKNNVPQERRPNLLNHSQGAVLPRQHTKGQEDPSRQPLFEPRFHLSKPVQPSNSGELPRCLQILKAAQEQLKIVHTFQAVKRNQLAVLEEHFKQGVSVYSLDSRRNTLLHQATSDLTAGCVLTHFPEAINAQNTDGDTPLHVAIKEGKDATFILYLLGREGIDLLLQNKEGNTVLHQLALTVQAHQHLEIVRQIIQQNEDISAVENHAGKTALQVLEDRKANKL